MTWKAGSRKALLPFCWHCSRKFIAGGRVFAVVEMNDGTRAQVHKDCARRIVAAQEGTVIDETTSAAVEAKESR